MLAEERQARILALVNRQKSVKLTDLCESLDMSASTARRDLKEQIARYAASLVENGDCVFIDAGTTTGAMIDFLDVEDALFVTNGMVHALRLAKRGFRVMSTGGTVKGSTEALVGTECLRDIMRFNFTKCFMGCNGISVSRGGTTPDSMEATIKEMVIRFSEKSYVLADHLKFDRITTVKFAEADMVTAITDQLINEKYKQFENMIALEQ